MPARQREALAEADGPAIGDGDDRKRSWKGSVSGKKGKSRDSGIEQLVKSEEKNYDKISFRFC